MSANRDNATVLHPPCDASHDRGANSEQGSVLGSRPRFAEDGDAARFENAMQFSTGFYQIEVMQDCVAPNSIE